MSERATAARYRASSTSFDKAIINIYQLNGNFKWIAPVSRGVLLMIMHTAPVFIYLFFYIMLAIRKKNINPDNLVGFLITASKKVLGN